MVDLEPGSFRFAGGYATGARLPDFQGLHWIGDENWGHFENENGEWIDAIPTDTNPPRVEILDVEPPAFIGTSRQV